MIVKSEDFEKWNKDTKTVPDDWKTEDWEDKFPKPKDSARGWICPKCGRANAPWKGSCDCSNHYYPTPYYVPYFPTYPTPYYYEITCHAGG
jgi:hypothetical protein